MEILHLFCFLKKKYKEKLKTFTDIRKKSQRKCYGKEVVLKANRKLFGQTVLITESRKFKMSNVLFHPLRALPWALANVDGSSQYARPRKQLFHLR